ncbi:MAG: dynamin family protein [Gammaproteobacteria bacterium]|nr:dynamin family protein [Gammaproteobacteria bacterium]
MPESIFDTQIDKRLKHLEAHLAEENKDNPTLVKAVKSFRNLDRIAVRLGILGKGQSYATRVSWWPMVSVLGTFSAGKSTFINYYLGHDLQRTGNQAVDDKFTVISFSSEEGIKTLPGVALDADPRFPFYQISRSIAEISSSGPQRIDAYLQLKTCPSEALRGRIFIDSPGFDADSQRAATLRLTEHIINLSDLVLVFFDARHPEPGAMHDTLDYLVSATIDRADSNKFLYILNQIDITAKEDNPEEVVAAWQRALAQAGLTAGRFFRIYNPQAAIPIDDPKVKERFETKRDADMADIDERMKQVDVERCYRIVGALEQTAKDIEHGIVPRLTEMIARWKQRVIRWDGVTGVIVVLLLAIIVSQAGDLPALGEIGYGMWIGLAAILGFGVYLHFVIRKRVAQSILDRLPEEISDKDMLEQIQRAFSKNTPWWRPLMKAEPFAWSQRTREEIACILDEANEYIQALNNRFTNPSGKQKGK